MILREATERSPINDYIQRIAQGRLREVWAKRERIAMYRLTAQPRCRQCNRKLTLATQILQLGKRREGFTCETCEGFIEWDERPPVGGERVIG